MLSPLFTGAPSRQVKIPAATFLLTLVLSWLPFHAHAGWEVEWIDTFDGDSMNWDYWYPQVEANYNAEAQCYTNDDSSPNRNFDVSDGTVKIIARRGAISCPGLGGVSKAWTSGRINSKDRREFLYGRIELRARFEANANGAWPAFWALEGRINQAPVLGDNDTVGWNGPGAGEIDIWEYISRDPNRWITNIIGDGQYLPRGPQENCGTARYHNYPGGVSDVREFQEYAMEWTADEITFWMNGNLVTTYNMTACTQFEEPMFVLLNVAVGGMLGGNIDGNLTTPTLEVDYVAYCSSTNNNSATGCGPDTPAGVDDDADGITNYYDRCANTGLGETIDADGCADGQVPVGPTIPPTPPPTPTPEPVIPTPLPGEGVRIQAEDYVDFFDTTGNNIGGAYTNDGVDIESCGDEGCGYNVGWTEAGEWLEYEHSLDSGTYALYIRVASNSGTGELSLSAGGASVAASVGNTGGWQTYETMSLGNIDVIAGSPVRIDINAAGANINWIQLGAPGPETPIPDPTPTPEPNDPTPTPEPNDPTPTPEPNDPTPTPEPNDPTPTPGPNEPTPTPGPNEPTPTPGPNEPTPTPSPNEPTPTPGPNAPTPTPVLEDPVPTPSLSDDSSPGGGGGSTGFFFLMLLLGASLRSIRSTQRK